MAPDGCNRLTCCHGVGRAKTEGIPSADRRNKNSSKGDMPSAINGRKDIKH
jgi:hypothetical protein